MLITVPQEYARHCPNRERFLRESAHHWFMNVYMPLEGQNMLSRSLNATVLFKASLCVFFERMHANESLYQGYICVELYLHFPLQVYRVLLN
jgi:hypothetical protein